MPVIDLYTSSKALAEKWGPKKSAELANREGDHTHFNEKGAQAMADLVMKELPDVAGTQTVREIDVICGWVGPGVRNN